MSESYVVSQSNGCIVMCYCILDPNFRPVAGFTLVRVEAVVNEDVKVALFKNNLGRMRENIAAYNADIGSTSISCRL